MTDVFVHPEKAVENATVGCGYPGGVSQGISMFYDERICCFLDAKDVSESNSKPST